MGQIGEFTPEQYEESQYTLLRKPLTKREVKAQADKEGRFEGIIEMGLATIINLDPEEFLDELNNRLCDSLLSDIQYEIVGFTDNNELHLKVSGEIFDVDDEGGDEEGAYHCECGCTFFPDSLESGCPVCHKSEGDAKT